MACPCDLEPIDGRSSNGYLPFFNLQLGQQGVIVGLGWSGQWAMNAVAEGPRVRLHGGQSNLDLRLGPGERIRSPRVLLVHWQGERLHGQNLWRRVLRDHYSPLLDGKRPLPFVQCNTWFPLRSGENATETKLISYLNEYAGSGLDYLVMDAGWYGASGKPWNLRPGSWIPNPQQFPDGLAPVGNAAKQAGIGFGLWFEPERVVPGTSLDQQHSDWILRLDPPRYRADNPMLDAGLLHLGKREVQDWLTKIVSQYVEQTPLAYFRHDFNHFNSISFLRAADEPGRTGINEIRYAEGLYRVLDNLRTRFPSLVMEGCASGGRRIDLETLQRNHLYWKADHIYGEPCYQQSTLFAGLHWLPGGFLNSTVLDLKEDRYALHSTLGGSLTVGWDPTQTKPDPKARYFKQAYDPVMAEAQLASFKAVRHLFDGDFFPLTPYSPNPAYWLGWQFHRDDLDEGVAVIFRRKGQLTRKGSWSCTDWSHTVCMICVSREKAAFASPTPMAPSLLRALRSRCPAPLPRCLFTTKERIEMRIERMLGNTASLKPLTRLLPVILLLLPLLATAEDKRPGAAAVISVRDHGAKGDGCSDDSAAFQAAFELAAASPHSVVRIPAGAYRLERQVDIQFQGGVDQGLAITGDGQGVSVIQCANEDGALCLHSELCQTQVTVRDLTLVAEIPARERRWRFFRRRAGCGTTGR